MATSYPSGIDAWTNPTGTDTLDSATVPHATQHTNLNDAVEAIEAELGTLPKGSFGTVRERLEAIEGKGWTPAQLGFKAWNYDPKGFQAGTVLPANGTLYVQKLYTPASLSVTNVHYQVITAGASLTANQNFAGLYSSAGALLGSSADQSTGWTNVGTRTMALTGGPFTVAAGFFYVALYSNGTTRPSMGRLGNNIGGMNGLLSAANSRWASANTGLTTALPATLGALTATNIAYWAAVS